MANSSLSSQPLSDNEVQLLTKLLEDTFADYCRCFSPSEADYFRYLKTVIGLGFTITLVDGTLLPIYENRLNIFLQYHDIHQHQGALNYLSCAIAEMINQAVGLFRLREFPSYYKDFVENVNQVMHYVALCNWDKQEETKKLLEILFKKAS